MNIKCNDTAMFVHKSFIANMKHTFPHLPIYYTTCNVSYNTLLVTQVQGNNGRNSAVASCRHLSNSFKWNYRCTKITECTADSYDLVQGCHLIARFAHEFYRQASPQNSVLAPDKPYDPFDMDPYI